MSRLGQFRLDGAIVIRPHNERALTQVAPLDELIFPRLARC